MLMMGSGYGSLSKSKPIFGILITFMMFWGLLILLDTDWYAFVRLFGHSSLPFRYMLLVSSTSFLNLFLLEEIRYAVPR